MADNNNQGTTTSTVPTTLPSETDTGLGSGDGQKAPEAAAYFDAKYNEAWQKLRSFGNSKDRIKFLNIIRSRGYLSGSEVSLDGLGEADRIRMRDFLVFADVSQKSFAEAQTFVESLKPVSLTGSTRMPTPKQDVDFAFKQVVMNQLGRAPKKSEIEKFRNAYASMEKGMNPPSVSSAAQENIQAASPEEAQASRFAEIAQTFEQMLRGA